MTIEEAEHATATRLYEVISKVAADVGKGRAADDSCSEAADALRSAGFGEIDYVVVRDSETLAEITQPLARPARVLAAAAQPLLVAVVHRHVDEEHDQPRQHHHGTDPKRRVEPGRLGDAW